MTSHHFGVPLTVGRNAWNRPSPLAIASSMACRASSASACQAASSARPRAPFRSSISMSASPGRFTRTTRPSGSSTWMQSPELSRMLWLKLSLCWRSAAAASASRSAAIRARICSTKATTAALEVALDRHGDETERDGDEEADNPEAKAPRRASRCLVLPLDEQRAFRGAHLAGHGPHVVHDALATALSEPRTRPAVSPPRAARAPAPSRASLTSASASRAGEPALLRGIVCDEFPRAGRATHAFRPAAPS